MMAPTLSSRELQIAEMVVKGSRNAEIAQALDLSPKTIKNHMHRIFGKAGVNNRTQLAVWYMQQPERAT